MHTASNMTAPSNDRTDKEFSQTMAESLTLADFESLSYKEQCAFRRLFPTVYDSMIALQEQARDGKPTTYYGMDTPHKGQETPQNISAEEWSKRIDDAIDRVMHRN